MKDRERFHEILKDIGDLFDRKNTDYARGGKQGPLGNFIRVAQIMSLYEGMKWDTPNGVQMVYMLKQLDAALMLLSQERESVTGEGVLERLKDVATYAIIGMAIHEDIKAIQSERLNDVKTYLVDGQPFYPNVSVSSKIPQS